MLITATEFKTNIGKYLKLAAKEDIIITKNGKRIAKLTNASEDKTDIVKSLIGILPNTISESEAREERLSKHERNA
ncbi:type II toxin-antitoxin system Phd/YefM family antitoxin [Zhaonella formicivorans]|jgi:prevent-host-death family protein|uniref:type II toxin-antitoxin system Phd/YefM family antitoxin n=1 Tax=Zhaonella formicivorans TaxID=2528593 RepID=UPI0010E24BB3|nr:type II toxin-antitoxin system prevent-host-death family antitoxin [Zhaonella formicivorans]